MEVQANFITNDTIKDKAAAALGLDAQSAFDIVRREDYPNEAAYIKALADVSEAMQKPEYQRARRKAAEEEQRRNEAAIRAEQRKEFQTIRRGVTLTQAEKERIDRQAADMARRDLAAGRIFASGLGAKIEEYAGQLTDSAKDSKASAMQFNTFIRREMNRATVNGGQH